MEVSLSMKKITFVLIAIVFLLSACSNTSPETKLEAKESSIYRRAPIEYCRVTTDTLEVKSGAGNSFSTIAVLKKGNVVKVLAQVNEWYVIRLDDNRLGSIDSAKTTPVVKEEPQPTTPDETTQPQETQPPAENPKPPVEPDTSLSAMEQQMVNQVNQERSKNNLNPLAVEPELTRMARVKAQDMVDNDYFSHNSPTYGSPFDMMDQFGIQYLTAGENLALNATVAKAHQALMNSSGHRKNILNPNFTHIGIGIKKKDSNSYIFVQAFIGR